MATKTALAIVRSVAPRLGIATPNTATGSTDVQIQQLLALVNEEGQELAARHDWQELTYPVTFPAVAVQAQGIITDLIADNLGGGASISFRKILNDTMWNLTKRVKICGPLTAPHFNMVTAAATANGPWSEYRIRRGILWLYPVPDAGDEIRFEFVTDSWATAADETVRKTAFTADDDICHLDARLVELGTIWRWKAAKGLDYAQNFQNYENAVLDAMTGNKTGGPVSMDYDPSTRGQPYAVIGRSDWLQ